MKKVLSSADVTKLRRTMADVDKLRGQIRTLHDRSKSSKRAGAHYVVKTPSGGIPASIGDEPGSADCTIHIRDGDPKELRDTTRPETVYNFGPDIPGDTILIAHRDAWGDLWAGESGGSATCTELGDLQPGSYRGIAGATTAPGETGPVIVTGCDGDVTIDAVNHSGCTFYLGDLITVNVDPCCVAHFTGCSCCGAEDTPPACCERSIVICIAGERQILAVDGGTYTWDVSECCDCEGATLGVSIACVTEGETTTITATWTYNCGESESTGTINLLSLCNDDADVEILGELGDICDGSLNDRWANFVEDCEPCETFTSPCEDCDVVATLGTSFGFTAGELTDLELDASSLTISRSSLQTNDIYTIDFVLSKEFNANSDTFRIDLLLGQSEVLFTSVFDQDGNVPAGATPTILNNGAAFPCADPCNCGRTVRWNMTLNAETIYTFRVRAGFIKCTAGGSTGRLDCTNISQGGSDADIDIWDDDCTECP